MYMKPEAAWTILIPDSPVTTVPFARMYEIGLVVPVGKQAGANIDVGSPTAGVISS